MQQAYSTPKRSKQRSYSQIPQPKQGTVIHFNNEDQSPTSFVACSEQQPSPKSTILLNSKEQKDQREIIHRFRQKHFLHPNGRKKEHIVEESQQGSDIYEGEKDESGAKEGYGIMWYSSGDCYCGMWSQNLYSGEGAYFHNDRNRYSQNTPSRSGHHEPVFVGVYKGEFKNGAKNGNGEFYFENEDVYLGNWENDKFHGEGVLKLHSHSVYFGEFRGGLRHNRGQIIYTDGTKFKGTFCSDMVIYGSMTYPDGAEYKGEWKEFKKHGNGCLIYANKDKYLGRFVDDEFDGMGEYRFGNGDYYVGSFKGSRFHGKGTYVYSFGTSYKGEWENGVRGNQGEWFGLDNYNSKYQILQDSVFNINKGTSNTRQNTEKPGENESIRTLKPENSRLDTNTSRKNRRQARQLTPKPLSYDILDE